MIIYVTENDEQRSGEDIPVTCTWYPAGVEDTILETTSRFSPYTSACVSSESGDMIAISALFYSVHSFVYLLRIAIF